MTLRTTNLLHHDPANRVSRPYDPILDDVARVAKETKLTYEKMAEMADLSVGTISRWLSKDTRFPRVETIRRFFNAFGYELVVVPHKSGGGWN